MKLVALSQGMFATVSDDDFSWASQYKWFAVKHRHTFYAQRALPRKGARQQTEKMHRAIIKARPGQRVDHKDGDGLNNRRRNLRIATPSQNGQNLHRSKNQRAGKFKGISWHSRDRKWEARIRAGALTPSGRRKSLHLGYFASADAAARAYDSAAMKHFGQFARLNFPKKRS